MTKKSRQIKKEHLAGFTLVEVLVSVVILSSILITIITSLVVIMRSYHKTIALRIINSSAELAMDRMIKIARYSSSVSDTGTYGIHPGILVLEKANTSPGVPAITTAKYELSGDGRLKFIPGDGWFNFGNNQPQQFITATGTRITNLIFRKLSSGVSTAVRIEMTMEAAGGGYTAHDTFYGTVVLGRSY